MNTEEDLTHLIDDDQYQTFDRTTTMPSIPIETHSESQWAESHRETSLHATLPGVLKI